MLGIEVATLVSDQLGPINVLRNLSTDSFHENRIVIGQFDPGVSRRPRTPRGCSSREST